MEFREEQGTFPNGVWERGRTAYASRSLIAFPISTVEIDFSPGRARSAVRRPDCERGFHGLLDRGGGFVLVEGVAEHERGGKNLRDGIGDALARDVGRGTAARFVEAERAIGQRGAGQQPERADRRRGFVADDVAEKILAEHDVELLRLAHELHGGVVDVHEFERHVGILRRDGLHRLAPEQAGLEHVGLVDERDALAPQPRGLEGDVGDPLDFLRLVDHGVDRALAALDGDGLLGLAEIESAGQFAHDQHVEAVGNPFAS